MKFFFIKMNDIWLTKPVRVQQKSEIFAEICTILHISKRGTALPRTLDSDFCLLWDDLRRTKTRLSI